MGSFSIWHWLIVLVVVLLIFGTKRLKNIGEDLGNAIKGFKKGIQDGQSEDKSADSRPADKLTDESSKDAGAADRERAADKHDPKNSGR